MTNVQATSMQLRPASEELLKLLIASFFRKHS